MRTVVICNIKYNCEQAKENKLKGTFYTYGCGTLYTRPVSPKGKRPRKD
jgi:hypothetical protein